MGLLNKILRHLSATVEKTNLFAFAELYCASVSKQVFVYELSFENEFDMPGNLKSMSTRGPDRGDTCHLTDFSETWPD